MALAPDVFWRMSVIEWRAAVAGRFPRARTQPMNRAALVQLMKEFPDG